MDFSKLTYAEVMSVSEQLKTSSAQMESLLEEVRALFNQVGTDDVWSGTAAATSKASFDTLAAKFPEFSRSVHDCSNHLVSVVENYQQVDTMVSGQ